MSRKKIKVGKEMKRRVCDVHCGFCDIRLMQQFDVILVLMDFVGFVINSQTEEDAVHQKLATDYN